MKLYLCGYQSHSRLYIYHKQKYEVTYHVDGCKRQWMSWEEPAKEKVEEKKKNNWTNEYKANWK